MLIFDYWPSYEVGDKENKKDVAELGAEKLDMLGLKYAKNK